MRQINDIVVIKRGKTDQHWKITHHSLSLDQYGAVRWIKKNKKWSGTCYLIGENEIDRIAEATELGA